MNGGFLLDTNIVIGIIENDPSVTGGVDADRPLYLSSIVMGELYFGAHNSSRVQHNLQRLAAWVRILPVLACDLETAQVYGQLRTYLRKKGRPLPDNDIWIAALAQQRQLTLLSRDRHFREFATLAVRLL